MSDDDLPVFNILLILIWERLEYWQSVKKFRSIFGSYDLAMMHDSPHRRKEYIFETLSAGSAKFKFKRLKSAPGPPSSHGVIDMAD